MSTTILQGTICYRTKLMTASDANRFARCLSANSRFTGVEVVTSPRAKGEKTELVTFQPSSSERRADLCEDQWNARKLRAIEEGDAYIIVRDESNRGSWVFNPISGMTYFCGLYGCTCADYVYRCRKAALHCKHLQACQIQSDKGMIIETEQAQPLAA